MNFFFTGTREERGITAWQAPDKVDANIKYDNGLEIYEPLFFSRWRDSRVLKYIPFLPDPSPVKKRKVHKFQENSTV